MLQFCNLYSGSTGNCSLVETESTKILIDCGESVKKITSTLSNLCIDINELDGIVVTHEHSDHTKSIGALSSKYNIPVYANENTWNNMPSQTIKINENNKNIFKTNDNFEIGNLKLHSFSIPHDAADPCGFNIFHDNKKISVATDLGHVTKEIYKKLEDSQFVLLEANYDPEILKYSRYPYILKKRITGPNRTSFKSRVRRTIISTSKIRFISNNARTFK